ncbi:S8 family serine peptidase [Bacillus cereus]|nr:S8 family serine peptidase [Bacillus cereus]
MIKVLNYIADKIDVLSNSWGGSPYNFWSLMVIKRITELALSGERRQKGIVFLWVAGNEKSLINHSSSVEISYTQGWEFDPNFHKLIWNRVHTSKHFRNNLVGIPGVMQVAVLSSTAQRNHYSNYGTGISISVPSNNIHLYSSNEALRLPVKGLGITTTTGRS